MGHADIDEHFMFMERVLGRRPVLQESINCQTGRTLRFTYEAPKCSELHCAVSGAEFTDDIMDWRLDATV